jgi:membrane associated rhomboid family serine protease
MIYEYAVVDREWIYWMYPLKTYANGEVWRHLTSTLLHGGPIHLLFNMYWIWYFGRAIEGRWGPHGMVLLWVAFGFASSAIQWTFSGAGIGMSGVLYGLFGMVFVLRKTKDYAARTAHPQVNQVLLGWFVLCFFIGHIWNIGNWAHGGGLAAGFLLGKAIDSKYRSILVPAAFVGMIGFGVLTIWIERMPVRLS